MHSDQFMTTCFGGDLISSLLVEGAVRQINKLIEGNDADELMAWLQKPEGLLPVVDPSRPYVYLDNLKKYKYDKGGVSIQLI